MPWRPPAGPRPRVRWPARAAPRSLRQPSPRRAVRGRTRAGRACPRHASPRRRALSARCAGLSSTGERPEMAPSRAVDPTRAGELIAVLAASARETLAGRREWLRCDAPAWWGATVRATHPTLSASTQPTASLAPTEPPSSQPPPAAPPAPAAPEAPRSLHRRSPAPAFAPAAWANPSPHGGGSGGSTAARPRRERM